MGEEFQGPGSVLEREFKSKKINGNGQVKYTKSEVKNKGFF